MTRVMKAAAALVAVLALVAGCGSGPSRVDAAAIVGKDTVPLAGFQDRITRLIAEKAGARQAQQQRTLAKPVQGLLSFQILHLLLDQVGGLQADQRQVRQALASPQLGQLLAGGVFDRATYAQFVADETRLEDLARKQGPGLRVTTDAVVVGDENTAKDLARRVAADPAHGAQLMTAAGRAGINQTLNPLQDLQVGVSTPLFGLAPGTVAAFPAGQQATQWLVVRILRREQGPATVSPQILDQVQPDAQVALGQRLLAGYADQVGVRVNPRYGVWDQFDLAVAPDLSKQKAVAYRPGAGSA